MDEKPLAGLWLRQFSSDYVYDPPVLLPNGALGLAQVEVRATAGLTARVAHWVLFGRSGTRDSGELDLPALAFWQALAHVERELTARGVRMASS